MDRITSALLPFHPGSQSSRKRTSQRIRIAQKGDIRERRSGLS
jgi:hypothetical protein